MSKNRVCLITGASAGIGAALADVYAKNGWDLVLVARRKDKLEDVADRLVNTHNVKALVLPCDLEQADNYDKLLNDLRKTGRDVDGLINNAGYGLPGTFTGPDWEAREREMQLMVMGPLRLTHALLPHMKAQRFGHIMNVASLAGHMPGSKGHTLYAAIKSFLIKFSQSLNLECEGHGVHVTALCPGFTKSEFHDVNGTRERMDKLPGYMWMDADEVADEAWHAISKNKAVHIPGRVNKAIATLGKVLPEPIAQSMMRRQSEKFRRGEDE